MSANTNTPVQKSQKKSSTKYVHPFLSAKKPTQEFNPGLYITSTVNEQDIAQIKQVFDSHDTNGTGILTPNDLRLALFHQNYFASKDTLYDIIAEYDEDFLGGLTFQAFIRIVTSHPAETESRAELKKTFRKYDRNNKGYITKKDMQVVLKSLEDNATDQDLDEIFEKLDKQKTGQIDFDRFCVLMHHPDSLS